MPSFFSNKIVLRRVLVLGSLLALPIAFQNCGNVSIVDSAALLKANEQAIQFADQTVFTDVNQSASVNLEDNNLAASQGRVISFEKESVVLTKATTNGSGTISVVDGKIQITYTPNYGFRGTDYANIYISYSNNSTRIERLRIEVQNPKLNFKPAVAVRAPACLLCHSSIEGDLITDLGYKGVTDTGPDLFMKSRTYNVSHDWGEGGFRTAAINGNIVIPKANFTDFSDLLNFQFYISRTYVENGVSIVAATIKEYVDKAASPAGAHKGVVEATSLYIGSPTVAEIITAGRLTATARQNFVKNAPDSPELSGLTHVVNGDKDYFTNTANEVLVCEGDLFLDGVVLLDRANIRSDEGCRIYATRSVFVSGPVVFDQENALTNLEIASARGIYMGIGYCVSCDNGYINMNTLTQRWAGTIQNYFSDFRLFTKQAHMAAIAADMALVTNMPTQAPAAPGPGVDPTSYYMNLFKQQGVTLVDANNSFVNEGATKFERILLNAPDVQSRYAGDFRGTIIAEFAMWRLGQFKFKFDPVFKVVPIFPMLKMNKILSAAE